MASTIGELIVPGIIPAISAFITAKLVRGDIKSKRQWESQNEKIKKLEYFRDEFSEEWNLFERLEELYIEQLNELKWEPKYGPKKAIRDKLKIEMGYVPMYRSDKEKRIKSFILDNY